MLDYTIHWDPEKKIEWIETRLKGKELLLSSLLNKGTAFTCEERLELGLLGKLPLKMETLEVQAKRAYTQFQQYNTDLTKYVYLNNLHDKNEILFYHLLLQHLSEMIPIVYTPVVGEAVKNFNREFRQPRGLYIAYPNQDQIEVILQNRTHPRISIVVVTDGERVLGIGDQGTSAIHIPVSKLTLYTLCGINPYHTLPIVLDVGTNNQALLNDPFYLGWQHPRISGKDYDAFIKKFVCAFQKEMPNAFLHWEDFGRDNARRILECYKNKFCTFNGDMQGTSVVALGALLSAMRRIGSVLKKQRIVIFGAGTAGVGIADRIVQGMIHEGCTISEAQEKIWLVDREGLLRPRSKNIQSFQEPYLKNTEALNDLYSVMKAVKPTILIGCSTVGGAFTKEVVDQMCPTQRAIIFPLSNPSTQSEATPEDLLAWTQGRALIATGSPFKTLTTAQCNNFFAFPGIGLGIVAAQANRLTENMLWAAAKTLSRLSPTETDAPLLPKLSELPTVAYKIAYSIVEVARSEGVSGLKAGISTKTAIDLVLWKPYYRAIKSAN